MPSTQKRSVLFLCSGNSARSQMAEALLRHQAPEYFDAFSAGTQPEKIDPRTISTLSGAGTITDQLSSKTINVFQDRYFDYVITLCDRVREECTVYPRSGRQLTWSFEDPKTRECTLPFQTTLNEIKARVSLFVLVETKQNV